MAKKTISYDLSKKEDIARFRRSLNRFLKGSAARKRKAIDGVVQHLQGLAEAQVTQTRKGVSMTTSHLRVAGQPTNVTLAMGRGMR